MARDYETEKKTVYALRQSGKSIVEIQQITGLPRGTVNNWCQHVTISDEQMRILRFAQKRGLHKKYKDNQDIREKAHKEGREKAKLLDPLHLAGCMLYWCEGAKAKSSRHTLSLVNSDPEMIKVYMRFLRESLNVPNEEIFLKLTIYDDIDESEAIEFWSKVCNLHKSSFKKTQIKKSYPIKQYSHQRKMYGCCTVMVYKTKYVHHVLAAIQQYFGFNREDWSSASIRCSK